jgi:uncharacterized protein (UPF0264 family)
VTAVPLLVSVRNSHEADEALAGGADWVDLKEPSRGALGAVTASIAREAVATIAGRAPASAAAGELLDWPQSPARELLGLRGVTHLKLGLSGCAARDWRPAWRNAEQEIRAAGQQLVAVVYADERSAAAPRNDEIVALAIEVGSPWVLWDTFDKSNGSILDALCVETLARQLETVRAAGVGAVIAGRVTVDLLDRLPLEGIDMIAVRGAACQGGRESQVCRERVSLLRRAIARHSDCRAVLDAPRGVAVRPAHLATWTRFS